MMSLSVWIIIAVISSSQITNAWRFVCYKYSFSYSKSVDYPDACQLMSSEFFDTTKPTAICLHGYGGSPGTQGTNLLIDAFLKLCYNTCAVDYSGEANIFGTPFANYPFAVQASLEVSEKMADMFILLEPCGFNTSTLKLVGHSLGAHVAGLAGRIFTEKTGRQIAEIVGLDPAQLGFEGEYHPYPRISQNCAAFVVVIHTDEGKGRYGMKDPGGHIDIRVCPIEYTRDGKQPGCPDVNRMIYPTMTPEDACSHQRSVRLFVEALLYLCQFLAAKAESASKWASTSYVVNEVTSIGENTNQTLRGEFFLRTAAQSSFCLGLAGLRPT